MVRMCMMCSMSNARGPGKEVTIIILSPNDRVGGVIGKSASIINQISQESGARIKIVEIVFDSEETEIVVSALEFVDDQVSPTIEARLQLLGLKMKVTSQHNS